MDWVSLLGSADDGTQRQACEQGLSAMKPLLQLEDDQDHPCDLAVVRKFAKVHGGPVTAALRAVSALLQPTATSTSAVHARLAEVACASLHCLDRLRPALKSKGLELESQRFGFIRRFMAAGLHHAAVSQGWKLRSLLIPVSEGGLPPQDLVELQSASASSFLASLVEVLSWPATDARLEGLPDDPLDMLRAVIQDVGMLISHK